MCRLVQFVVLVFVVFGTFMPTFAADLIWDGGDGDWADPSWNGGMIPLDVLGQKDGTESVGDHIIIGDGNVLYDADGIGSDFRVLQGSDMSIVNGSWTQLTLPSWGENRWTEMDLSTLTIDNGTFLRVGSGTADGDKSGGALIFGSWKGDDNFDELPAPQVINILITNGGRLESEGQMWFGAGADHPAEIVIDMTIDNGHVDLTGGQHELEGFPADWAFFLAYDEAKGAPRDEQYSVNFIGPGSITVDQAGLVAPFQLETLEWVNLEAIGYQDLWNFGILKANGLGDEDGLTFDDFFSVEGDIGSENYTLISKIGGVIAAGCDFDSSGSCDIADIDQLMVDAETGGTASDMNNDGVVNMVDRDLWLKAAGEERGLAGPLSVGDTNLDQVVNAGDLNAIGVNWLKTEARTWSEGNITTEGGAGVSVADLNALGLNWQSSAAAATAAVPEPTGIVLFVSAIMGWALFDRRRR